MPGSPMRIVIVGNGVAGMEAALAAREREPRAAITIVSEESDQYFSRTALMWVCSGQLSQRDIEPLERDAYARHGLRRVRARAIGVDVHGRALLLGGGLAPLPYDRLLLACGSRPRAAPWASASLRGVGAFVTLQDLEWLERELHGDDSASSPDHPLAHLPSSDARSPYYPRVPASRSRGRPASSFAVVGGGLIGVEALEVALAAGLSPRLFVREEGVWPVALDPRESAFVLSRMREHGVDVHLDEEVRALEGDEAGNVARVVTERSSHEAECVVVAIGVVPNTEWLEGSAIERDAAGGVLVDESQRTHAPSVFAAGDCASVRWADGTIRPEPLWYTARDQGRVAGRGLVGEHATYARGTWYNSAKLMDIEHTTAGTVSAGLEGERQWFFEETGAVRSTSRIVTVDDRVVGVSFLGRRWDHSVFVRFIEDGRSLAYVLDHLAEAAFDTELVPPLRIPARDRPRTP
jgi:NADPH-dependent 2,4-dienoyl-CoA reductase/sulfur reductase-like enzyme